MPLQNGRRSSNGEGYPDPTASSALSKVDRKEPPERKRKIEVWHSEQTPSESLAEFMGKDLPLKKARQLYSICCSILSLEGWMIEDIVLRCKQARVTMRELNPSKKGTEEHIAERISRKEGFDRT